MEPAKIETEAMTSEAEWTVQCMGTPTGFCGLVLKGPLSGLRIVPRLPYASSGLCIDCAATYARMMQLRRAID